MPQNNCPLVMVEWVDSIQPQSAWRYLRDIGKPKPVDCCSVGWLIADTAQSKVLAPSFAALHDPDHMQVSGVMVIPTRAVKRVVKLKEPRLSQ